MKPSSKRARRWILSRFLDPIRVRPTSDIAEVTELLRKIAPIDAGFDLVRIGCDSDGGYLLPDDLEGITTCFSPGVGTQASFEEAAMARGILVRMADGSVDNAPIELPRGEFTKRFVAANPSANSITLDHWVTSTTMPDEDLLLQMDIEGSEYEVLLSTPSETLARFRIMVIELHYLAGLLLRHEFRLLRPVFEKILMTHAVVHVHPNNCCGTTTSGGLTIPNTAEFTFLRRDRLQSGRPRTDFPHSLDRPNVAGPDLILPRCFYTTSIDRFSDTSQRR